MRLIGVAFIVFVLALTFVMSGFGPGVTAQELAGQSGNDDKRRHRDGQANGPQLLVAKGVEAEDVAECTKCFRRSFRRVFSRWNCAGSTGGGQSLQSAVPTESHPATESRSR
jgi:hypothetical protein